MRELAFRLHSELKSRGPDIRASECQPDLAPGGCVLGLSSLLPQGEVIPACAYPTRSTKTATTCVEVLEGKQGVRFAYVMVPTSILWSLSVLGHFEGFARGKSTRTGGLLWAPSAQR